MKFAALKRQFLLWGYTSAALVLLLIVGVAVSIWGSSQPPQAIGSLVANLPLGWWRAGIYSLLVLCWPRFVCHLTRDHRHDSSSSASRRPLIILIILYECLIVQNPLAALLDWVA
ncbi:hypothetical protein [uncultured Paraglaciecola sp.]|uniref:hypothetical protein n=1 Tax=uncultured Paraglaciecola sp. TaxID=1765024 RepID=UPI002605E0DC|nr:hypothetical protein [uncultured Paraglaciecola sp.]